MVCFQYYDSKRYYHDIVFLFENNNDAGNCTKYLPGDGWWFDLRNSGWQFFFVAAAYYIRLIS